MSVFSILAFLHILGGLTANHFWETKRYASRGPDEEDLLTHLARLEGTSELEQFRRAAENRSITERSINADFNDYLLRSTLPHYLRDYLRRKRKELPDLKQLLERRRDLLTCPLGPCSNVP